MAVNIDATWAGRTAKAILLVRILVGWVFLPEGIQKSLLPDSLGVGRFVKIGIPAPQVMAPFVGVVEIVCGTLLLVGFLTRLATVPLSSTSVRPCIPRRSSHLQRADSGVHCTKPAPT